MVIFSCLLTVEIVSFSYSGYFITCFYLLKVRPLNLQHVDSQLFSTICCTDCACYFQINWPNSCGSSCGPCSAPLTHFLSFQHHLDCYSFIVNLKLDSGIPPFSVVLFSLGGVYIYLFILASPHKPTNLLVSSDSLLRFVALRVWMRPGTDISTNSIRTRMEV